MEAIAAANSRTREVQRPDGGVSRRSDYFGNPGTIDMTPQAFLVELPYAGARVNPHFHDIDQFQVIVAGSGRLGKKALAPVTFQYADGYTPYGPIVAHDEGLSFFTLRNVASGGHFVMPGSRDLMRCRAGRNIAGHFGTDLQGADGASTEVLMPPQSDGVAAYGITLGPGEREQGPASDGGGQYALVCAGSLVADGEALPPNSLLRVEPDEPALSLVAGTEGAKVLVLQFARAGERPGADRDWLEARDPGGYVHRR